MNRIEDISFTTEAQRREAVQPDRAVEQPQPLLPVHDFSEPPRFCGEPNFLTPDVGTASRECGMAGTSSGCNPDMANLPVRGGSTGQPTNHEATDGPRTTAGHQDETPALPCNDGPNNFYPTTALCALLGLSRPSLLARARREGWVMRNGVRGFEFAPPSDLAATLPPPPAPAEARPEPKRISFVQLKHGEDRAQAQRREVVVRAYMDARETHYPGEAKEAVQYRFATLECPATINGVLFEHPLQFTFRTLEIWTRNYARHGLDGLCDQRQRCGRKAMQLPPEVAALLKAKTIELGSVAKAVQYLMLDPNLPAWLHEAISAAFASKSYVRASIGRQARPAALTTTLAAIGPRAARLSGPFTPGAFARDLHPGSRFVSDDMTSNVHCWVEDLTSPRGWRIGQAQILPVMDTDSLCILNARVIMRPGGQYNALDDICGLFGDVFESKGLPTNPDGTPGTFILEGGHWQSNAVIGWRTKLTTGDRIGGLASLGVKVSRAYDPRGKAMLEGYFNHFQHWCDAFRGYGGRDARKQMPEYLKKQQALCNSGRHHPSEFFPHIRELADHVADTMANMNNMRNDGQICRGATPAEVWNNAQPQLIRLPEESNWMFRSAMHVVTISVNGVCVQLGSGAKRIPYYYDNPEKLFHLKSRGIKARVYWNHNNPDVDAVLLDHRTGSFLCSAQLVRADDAEAEKARKKMHQHMARTEMRDILPYMARRTYTVRGDETHERISGEIAQAHAREEAKEAHARSLRREIARTRVDVDDVTAALAADAEEAAPRFNEDDLAAALQPACAEDEPVPEF